MPMTSSEVKLFAAPFTPMHTDGGLNLELVQNLARHLFESGVQGAFVCGTTGESQSLTVEERMDLAQRWRQAAESTGLEIIVQVGHNCQADARRLAAHARKIGADAVAALAPSFLGPTTIDELIDFCAPIAAEAGNLPFYYYEIPMLTGVALSMTEFLEAGRSRIPNLAGIKYTNFDLVQLQQLISLNDGSIDILFGCDEILLAAYVLGVRGAVGSTYNFAAPLFHRMIEAFTAGDPEAARADQARVVQMVQVMRRFGLLPAAKAVMGMMGLDCGPVRSPLRNLTPAQRDELQNELERLDLPSWTLGPAEPVPSRRTESPVGDRDEGN